MKFASVYIIQGEKCVSYSIKCHQKSFQRRICNATGDVPIQQQPLQRGSLQYQAILFPREEVPEIRRKLPCLQGKRKLRSVAGWRVSADIEGC